MTAYGYPDLEDDSMAANPEPARVDLGYREASAPRSFKPPPGAGHWGIVWIPGADRSAPLSTGAKKCAECPAEVAILHAVGDDPRRKVCGDCQGRRNRERMGSGR